MSTSKSKDTWDKVSANVADISITLGPIYSESLLLDPKHVLFTLSRYKFPVKMLTSAKRIVEIGCGEGVGALLVAADTDASYLGIDFDSTQIDYAKKNIASLHPERISFTCLDVANEPLPDGPADGLICLDVIEHIHPDEEAAFLNAVASCLDTRGTAIIGTPNLHANKYASKDSQLGHINLFDPERFRSTLEQHFGNVFLFSMNDEMVHTGFSPMAHYLMALCVK